MTLDAEAIQARYDDWYAEDGGDPLKADWSMRDDMEMDEPESLSHCIVRNDIPELLEEVRRLRPKPTDAP